MGGYFLSKETEADWKGGQEIIEELVLSSDEEEISQLIEPLLEERGGYEELIAALPDDLERQREIAVEILTEDLFVLSLELANKESLAVDGGYFIPEDDAINGTYKRTARLIQLCVLDDGVGFSWQVV